MHSAGAWRHSQLPTHKTNGIFPLAWTSIQSTPLKWDKATWSGWHSTKPRVRENLRAGGVKSHKKRNTRIVMWLLIGGSAVAYEGSISWDYFLPISCLLTFILDPSDSQVGLPLAENLPIHQYTRFKMKSTTLLSLVSLCMGVTHAQLMVPVPWLITGLSIGNIRHGTGGL